MTTQWYLNAPNGESYGLEHSPLRFSRENEAMLRPKTAVPGLFLTGQDVLTCGWMAQLASGTMTASAVLGKNLFIDMAFESARRHIQGLW